ncbi:MAG TPA: urease accessory protein UreE [Polyangia bacterium]|jgi:urease accessory protein|nr:urease accessory protein UreE [Polyangia bacterium]
MRKLTHAVPRTEAAGTASLTLPYEDRRRSRLRAALDDGNEVALLLPRGTVLRDGDCLGADDGGPAVRVRAADETLSVARTADPLLLCRAAYHLGNRHIALQIAPGRLAYQHDHVLDGMVRELGLTVTTEDGPFEPEAGGYRHEGTSGHSHGHDHHHDHGHPHRHARPRGSHGE